MDSIVDYNKRNKNRKYLIILLLLIVFIFPLSLKATNDEKITNYLYDCAYDNITNNKHDINIWIYFNNSGKRERYIKALESNGITILRKSNWVNAVSANVPISAIYELEKVSFITKLDAVRYFRRNQLRFTVNTAKSNNKSINSTYGKSYRNIRRTGIDIAQELGFTGKTVRISIFDSGYDLSHQSFERLNLVKAFDFVSDDTFVQSESGDPYGTDDHGTALLSLIAGYKEGKIIGGAYEADIILARTDDISAESIIREDTWIEAVEWAVENNAKIICSSLGVPVDNYRYITISHPDLYPESTLLSNICNEAAKRGTLIITNIGDENGDGMTFNELAYSNDVLVVGSLDGQDQRAKFSPVKDDDVDNIKPEIYAPGTDYYVADSISAESYTTASGTAYSMASVTSVAALVMEAHPDWTPYQVREALKQSSGVENITTTGDNPQINAFNALNYTPPTPQVIGDLNDDGSVDGNDLSIISLSFGKSCGMSDWNGKADLDYNCTIDGNDLVIFSTNFGK